jgi:hypothetical protein
MANTPTMVRFVAVAIVVAASSFACGHELVAPNAPNAPTIAGTWTGAGADVQGTATFTLTLTQIGDTISGTAVTQGNDADGTCASCHKSTRGTVSGTLRSGTLALTMFFPSGNDGVPTPMCSVRMTASASVTAHAINATYTGDDTCEGPITDGSFSLGNVTPGPQR